MQAQAPQDIPAAARARIERTFAERCRHRTQDELRTTRSLASAEAQFRDDYSGRFLIELLQNARDAYRKAEPHKRLGTLKILRTRDAISVANVGTPITADVVIGAITQIGASTKTVGEAIGHKGIGFKSVLEVSATPEIYSDRAADGSFGLAVRFDARAALREIRRYVTEQVGSGVFDEWIAGLQEAKRDPEHLPTLHYPIPNYEGEERAAANSDLARLENGACAFDTVVRLPIPKDRHDDTHSRITAALRSLETSMLLLIGCFERILIEDDIEPSLSAEILIFEDAGTPIDDDVRRYEVEVLRSPRHAHEHFSERWLLYRRCLSGGESLEREVAIGVLLRESDTMTLQPAAPPPTFHVFFPTEIRTSLPFLYHAYFWVNASRLHFAPGRRAENEELIRALGQLTEGVVCDLVSTKNVFCRPLDVRALPKLFAEVGGRPEKDLAGALQQDVYERLREIPWIASRSAGGWAKPTEMLVCAETAGVPDLMVEALPQSQIERIALAHPAQGVLDGATSALLERLGARELDEDLLTRLLRAARHDRTDASFLALLDVFSRIGSRIDVVSAIDAIRGDPEATLIPVVAADGGRTHVPPPVLEEKRGARRSMRLFEQPLGDTKAELGPPDCLGFAFLPALPGMREERRDLLKMFGVSEYSTDSVIARLGEPLASGSLTDEEYRMVGRFVWTLLSREGASEFSVHGAIGVQGVAMGFYRESVMESAPDDRRPKRRRALNQVRVPTRAGSLRDAGSLTFGASWAKSEQEQTVFAALERLAPSDGDVVCDATRLAEWLGFDDGAHELDDRADLLRAFLRQLGVWDVLPIAAFSDHTARAEEERVPWLGEPERDEQWQQQKTKIRLGGTFESLHTINVSEDARFLWPVVAGDREDTAIVLRHGRDFYTRQAAAAYLCPKCAAHSRNPKHARDPLGSLLAWQVQHRPWVPVTIDGGTRALARPIDAWIVHEQVDGRQAARSAWSFLPVVDSEYRDVAAIFGAKEVQTAKREDLVGVLRSLRDQFERGALARDPTSDSAARQAFCALHRRLYDRLADCSGTHALHDLGVLAEIDGELLYVDADAAWHDDGMHSAHRRHFSDLAFAVLAKEMSGEEAERLGVRTFRVRSELAVGAAAREDQTADFRQALDDITALALALQVHAPVRGPALEIGSNAFRDRAVRLHALRVQRVEELELALTVEGTVKTHHVPGHDFLEGATTSSPVLVHDYDREDAKRLMERLGRHVAALIEAPAAADTLTLMLQRTTPEERKQFLIDRGVSTNDIERVRNEFLRTIHAGLDDDEKRWWWSVLEVLGVSDVESISDHDGVARALAGREAQATLQQALESHDLGFGLAIRQALASFGPTLDSVLRRRGDPRGFVPPLPPAPTPPTPDSPSAAAPKPFPRQPALPTDTSAQVGPTDLGAIWSLVAKARGRRIVTAAATAATPEVHGDRSSGVQARSPIRMGKVRRDDQVLSRVGRQAELVALGFVLDPLVALAETSPTEFRRVIGELVLAVEKHMPGGPRVDDVLGYARRLLEEELDRDEQLQLLARFLHLSETSDAFGCDILAWLSVDGRDAAPIFLEVKSVANEPLRSFYVSSGEWATARALRSAYAFFVVPRETEQPEILVDPVAWNECDPKKLEDAVDTYRFHYRVADRSDAAAAVR